MKTPLKIPPRMMNGIARTGRAARPVLATVATPAKGRLTRKSIRRTTTYTVAAWKSSSRISAIRPDSSSAEIEAPVPSEP